MSEKQKILILGGGFGGIKTALELSKEEKFYVHLLSDQADFRYYPQLYHSATGGSHLAASIPLTEIFDNKAVSIHHGQAEHLDRQAKSITTTSGHSVHYDILIIALGVITNYFGIKGLQENSYGIKSLEDAQKLRDHIHEQLIDQRRPDANYVVIGGGPTGVELAGALPDYIVRVMKAHNLPPAKIHVDLVEAANRLVPRMPRTYSNAIAKRLRQLGVQIYLGQTVQAETADQLMVSGHPITSHSVVWTAGVTNNPFFSYNQFNLSQHGKVLVDEYLVAEENIFVIGDNADTTYSGMAQTALYDGLFVSDNLRRQIHGRKPRTYRPQEPVYVTPVGPRWAAVQWHKFRFYGWLAWLLRGAADFVGYHDLEPWWTASQHLLAQKDSEANCPICSERS